jgi:UPF0755 protein
MKKSLRIIYNILGLFLCGAFLFWWGIYVPANYFSGKSIIYTAQKGIGDDEIALELKKMDIINSSYFFRFYVVFSGKHAKLQAGTYEISSKMSTKSIIDKFVKGEVVKNNITIIEGWNLKDIENYLIAKNICTKESFFEAKNKDYSSEFTFLQDKPISADLEGYIFPDTYEVLMADSCEQVIEKTLSNFGKKLGEKNYFEILKQKKSVFDIVILASIIEKEVIKIEDKKIVSGILNNRLDISMPLQVCSTINYITGKNDPGVFIKDTNIDSPYNTYKYIGLPKAPISNPGIDSIMAVIYPTENNYLYFLSTKEGTTIFSKTLAEHNTAIFKYLK